MIYNSLEAKLLADSCGYHAVISAVSAPNPEEPSFTSLEDSGMAAKGKENRILVTLACVECKSRNYITEKNKKNDPERMELRKYCPRCREHRPHRETK